MLEIKYHPKAWAEAFKTADYYDRQDRGLGAAFFNELDAPVARMREEPLRAKADATGIRSWRLQRFRFRIYYAVDPDRIRIMAVADLRRIPGYWRKRIND